MDDGCGEGDLEGFSPVEERVSCSGEIAHSSLVGGDERGRSLSF